MKLLHPVFLAALSRAFVIPPEGVLEQVAVESHRAFSSVPQELSSLGEGAHELISAAEDAFQKAVRHGRDVGPSQIESLKNSIAHGPSALDDLSCEGEALHEARWGRLPDFWKPKRPHKPKKPHHGHHKSNKTVYELIAGSKYTTKLAGLINKYDDLVTLLNGTTANFTVFAPTDKAFAKIPKDAPEPSPEVLKKILTYHVSGDFYPAGRVLASATIPTLLNRTDLSLKPEETPQRLSFHIGLRGLTVNFLARVIAIDIVRHSLAFCMNLTLAKSYTSNSLARMVSSMALTAF